MKRAFGTMFVVALGLSWTFVTAVVALVIWAERAEPSIRIATWVSLWTFSVLTPTLTSLTIHRALGRISPDGPEGERAIDELSRLRSFVLLSATMALLSAFALIFKR